MDDTLSQFAPAWTTEVERRFPGSLVILTHGSTLVAGHWFILTASSDPQVQGTDVDELLNREAALYPGRAIILLCCNEASYALHGHPNVFYSPSTVWCIPDRAINDPQTTDDDDDPDKFRRLLNGRLVTIPMPYGLPPITIPGNDDEPPVHIPGLDVGNASPRPSRWAASPQTVGSIFEFVQAL